MARNNQEAISCAVLALFFFVHCGNDRKPDPSFLGSAVVGSRTCVVAAPVQGPLMTVTISEGKLVGSGELLAVIDTVPLEFSRQEVAAEIDEIQATVETRKAEIKAISIEVSGLEQEYARTDAMVTQGSMSVQQRDNLLVRLHATQARRDAALSGLAPLAEKEKGLRVKKRSIEDRIRRCFIVSPVDGVVLAIIRNRGEVVVTGSPILKIGTLDTLYADFFAHTPAISTLSQGQPIRVRFDWDSAGTLTGRFLPGTVFSIGAESELPDERKPDHRGGGGPFFRVRCMVPNDAGVLKRGVPVEIWKERFPVGREAQDTLSAIP